MTALQLATDALAAYRLTRLITADTITAPLRDRWVEAAYVAQGRAEANRPRGPVTITRQGATLTYPGDWAEVALADEQPPKLAELVVCRWCAGMWVALGVVAARRLAPRAWTPLATALALSAGAALLARLEDE
jgi:hypothetical protein